MLHINQLNIVVLCCFMDFTCCCFDIRIVSFLKAVLGDFDYRK